MMGMLKPRRPSLDFEDYAYNAAKGLYILCGFLLLVVIILVVAVGNHRAEINDLTRRIETMESALNKRGEK